MARYSWDDAVNIVEQRRALQEQLVRIMALVRSRYNAEYIVPAPAGGNDEQQPLVIANLVNDAIDGPAQMASSVAPAIFCPQVLPDKLEGTKSAAFADIRRRAIGSTLFSSKWELINRKLFRHIAGYGMAAMLLIQDERNGRPRLVLRDPLCTYPEPKAAEDLSPPANVGFVFQKAAGALIAQYPQLGTENGGPINARAPGYQSELWDVLEWVDHEQVLIGVLGPSSRPYQGTSPTNVKARLLKTITAKPGMPMCAPAVVPQLITLDKIISRAAQMVGKMDVLAYLWDLDIRQTKNAISPDRYVLSRPNEQARIISHDGQWMSGETGETNLLDGAQAIGELRQTPDPAVFQRMQAVQSAAMTEAGIIGPQVGNTAGMAGSLRTGRGISQLAGMSVDPRVQELQMICAEALNELGPMILSMYECYWPERKYVEFTGWAGDTSLVAFEPKKHFAESHHVVFNYAIPGADASTITVGLAQLKGAGAISASDFRRLHPWIADAEASERGVLIDKLEDMSMTALAQRSAQGGIPPEDMARIIELVRGGSQLEAAIIQAQKDAQARQAAQTPPESPEAQPGLGNPGEGAGAGAGAPPGPQGAPDVGALAQALFSPPGPGGQSQFNTSVGPRAAQLRTTQPA